VAAYLVTGGAGFVGSHLVEHLLQRGDRVRVLDDLSTGSCSNIPVTAEFIEADVTYHSIVQKVLEDMDGCFHLAAIASVEQCHREWLRGYQVNLTGTINVLDQARTARGGRSILVVYASSAAVYGNCGKARVSRRSAKRVRGRQSGLRISRPGCRCGVWRLVGRTALLQSLRAGAGSALAIFRRHLDLHRPPVVPQTG
jgi:nucleoside-diphosphate-sugar epimerase